MNTYDGVEKYLALANLMNGMNADTYRIADEAKRKVLEQTGDRLQAEIAWQQAVSMGYGLTVTIVKALDGQNGERK